MCIRDSCFDDVLLAPALERDPVPQARRLVACRLPLRELVLAPSGAADDRERLPSRVLRRRARPDAESNRAALTVDVVADTVADRAAAEHRDVKSVERGVRETTPGRGSVLLRVELLDASAGDFERLLHGGSFPI